MPTSTRRLTSIALVTMMLALVGGAAEARQLSRTVARSGSRAMATAAKRSGARLLALDRANHAKAKTIRLSTDRLVFRFTSKSRAAREASKGIRRQVHFTHRGGPGRPLSALRAKQTYGLPRRPTARESVRIPRGTPVKITRVAGGAPRSRELVTQRPVARSAIRRVIRVN